MAEKALAKAFITVNQSFSKIVWALPRLAKPCLRLIRILAGASPRLIEPYDGLLDIPATEATSILSEATTSIGKI